jgi:hypothetical protein
LYGFFPDAGSGVFWFGLLSLFNCSSQESLSRLPQSQMLPYLSSSYTTGNVSGPCKYKSGRAPQAATLCQPDAISVNPQGDSVRSNDSDLLGPLELGQRGIETGYSGRL